MVQLDPGLTTLEFLGHRMLFFSSYFFGILAGGRTVGAKDVGGKRSVPRVRRVG